MLIMLSMLNWNEICQTERMSSNPDGQFGPTNRLTYFSEREHITKKFRRSIILQLNIEGLTTSKMTVLNHLAEQLEALVILLQETSCISAENIVIPNNELAGSFLSRKHGLATLVRNQLKIIFLSLLPLLWRLSGCVISITTKSLISTPARIQDSDSQCSLTTVFMLVTLINHTLTRDTILTEPMEYAWLNGQI